MLICRRYIPAPLQVRQVDPLPGVQVEELHGGHVGKVGAGSTYGQRRHFVLTKIRYDENVNYNVYLNVSYKFRICCIDPKVSPVIGGP